MPRVVRKNKSAFDMKTLLWWGGTLLVVVLAFGGAYLLGKSDTGVIDINHKIDAVDQSTVAAPVHTYTAATEPNGGLHPQGAGQNPASAPAPTTPTPAPVVEASTTASTTQHATATIQKSNGVRAP